MARRIVFVTVIAWLTVFTLLLGPRPSGAIAQEIPLADGETRQALRSELTQLLTRLAAIAERDTMGGRMGYAGQSPSEAIELSRAVRLLAALPAAERYALLKQWMLPGEPGALPRFAMCFAPVEPPPEVFFSNVALPTANTSPSAEPDAPPRSGGVINFTELLVAAAAECGKLEELASASRTAEKVSQMVDTLNLVTILACKGDGPLARQAREIVAAWGEDQNRPAIAELKPWPTYLIARAWMAREEFRGAGEQLTDLLASHAAATGQASLLSCLLRDQAWCRAQDFGGMLPPGTNPGLAFWHPGGYYYHSGTQTGTWPGWWVEHEGVIAHLAGPEVSPLYFASPLQGEFELTVDAHVATGSEAAIQYGRFLFEPRWRAGNPCLLTVGERESVDRPDAAALPDQANQFLIRVRPHSVSYLFNGQLAYEDSQPSPTTPWLALVGRGTRRTFWSNLRLTGSPRVLPEVELIHDQRMEGWMSPLYRESLPRPMLATQPDSRSAVNSRLPPPHYAWYALDGVLHGNRMKTADRNRAIQSWLAYHRPLGPGETLSYEFFYDPAEKMVHPSLGRTALLLEPADVQLHWITDVPHMAIGGLACDNAVAVAPAQRGARPLNLIPGQWNQVTINMSCSAATVLLNGNEIYEHSLSATDNRMFGFFRYANRTAAEVRNIVLRGDWPASLSAQQWAHPLAREDGSDGAATARVRAALVDKSWIGGQ